MASGSDEDMRVKAYKLVARAEGDETFAKRAKSDPAAVLKEVGLSADLLKQDPRAEAAQGMRPFDPEEWGGCNDFTCWSSGCPGTCFVTFCHTTGWLLP